jgi:hypothetical protein
MLGTSYHSAMMVILRPSYAITAFSVSLALAYPAFADGRADWEGYSWQKIDISSCAVRAAELVCPQYHQKWDWKRDQWVDITINMDRETGQLQLSQQLSNNDPRDNDDVCVTVIMVDGFGRNLVAHHQNWHTLHGDVLRQTFRYYSSHLADAATIHLGSKQCRKGSEQDDAVYANVLARLSP